MKNTFKHTNLSSLLLTLLCSPALMAIGDVGEDINGDGVFNLKENTQNLKRDIGDAGEDINGDGIFSLKENTQNLKRDIGDAGEDIDGDGIFG